MSQQIIQRMLSTVLVLLGIATLVFFVMRVLPGDPISALLAQSGGSAADAAALRAQYELDRPLGIQYISFLADLATADLGRSVVTGQSVSQIIVQQAPETIALAMAAISVAVVLGLPPSRRKPGPCPRPPAPTWTAWSVPGPWPCWRRSSDSAERTPNPRR